MALSDVLAELYVDENSARRVAKAAGVDVARIAFTGTAANTWASLVEEAVHQKRLAEVVALALSEYPRHEALMANLFTMPMPPTTKDGFMNLNIPPTSATHNESEAAVIARLATQLEFLTVEVKRVSDGLNSIRNLNVDRIDRGLDDISYMRGRMTTLAWAVAAVTGMTLALGAAFLLHL